MRNSVKLGIGVLFAALFAAGAAQAAMEGNPKAGKDKSAMCAGCHGDKGMAAAPNFPNLAGQFQKYIERQMLDYQNGKRVDPMMTDMAKAVTDMQDLMDIAAYFATQKRMAGKPSSDKDLVAKGKKIFMEGNAATGVYACSNCHGDTGYGKTAKNNIFPVIHGQTRDYLLKTMNDYKSGERRNDPGGMMGDIAKKMTDDEIKAVVEFITGM